MIYNRCGNSGLLLPAISLGLWHNFGGVDVFQDFNVAGSLWRMGLEKIFDRQL